MTALPWPISARSDAELRARARRLAEHLRARPELEPGDVGYSLATGPPADGHRAVVLGADRPDLLAGLDALAAGHDHDAVSRGTTGPGGGVVLVFSGAGGQWRGMGGGLWEESPVFRDSVRACVDAFAPYLDWSLPDVLCGRRGAASLNRVDVVQPALFTLMVSLAAVWRSFGVRPAAVVGHSQGEIAAAYVAGALSLPDAARVVALRSQIIAGHLAGQGAMLSVPLPPAQVRDRLAAWGDRLAVAAVNGPATTSVAGHPDAVEELFTQLVDEGVRVARIVADFAAHSAPVDAIRRPLLDALGELRPRPSEVVFCSTVTGGVLDTTRLDAGYWFRNLRLPVDFDGAVRALLDRGLTTFVEPSSHPILTAAVEEIARDAGAEVTTVGSLRMGESDTRRMLTSLAAAYVRGVPVDWTAAHPGRTRVDLSGAEGPFWRAVERGDLAGALGVVLPALTGTGGAMSEEQRNHRLMILGAGVMGVGIATLGIGSGLPVTLVDVDPAKLDEARRKIRRELKLAQLMGALPKGTAPGELVTTASIEEASGATVVIEAVTEQADLKAGRAGRGLRAGPARARR